VSGADERMSMGALPLKLAYGAGRVGKTCLMLVGGNLAGRARQQQGGDRHRPPIFRRQHELFHRLSQCFITSPHFMGDHHSAD